MKTKSLEANPSFREYYEKLSKVFAYAADGGVSIDSLCGKFFNIYPHILCEAETEEEKAFVSACAQEIAACYQKALERNYNEIKDLKERGVMDSWAMENWILTLDQNGTPTVTTVVGVNEKGYPVYADGCVGIEIVNEVRAVGNYRYELNKWLESNGNLYELRVAAEELKKKGTLGMSPSPEPNYDLSGLSGGQLDAAAWQNYAIENGMVSRTDYDETLDRLLVAIDKCIDFYEKAISIV